MMSRDNISMLTDEQESLGVLLHDSARLMRYRFDARARDVGVTRQQWRALYHLARNEGMTQAELSDLLEVERITLCRMIDRLSDAGLVERRADPQDRRVWRLHLLPPAYDIVQRLSELGAELEREVKVILGGDYDRLTANLNRLRDGLRDDAARRKVA